MNYIYRSRKYCVTLKNRINVNFANKVYLKIIKTENDNIIRYSKTCVGSK